MLRICFTYFLVFIFLISAAHAQSVPSEEKKQKSIEDKKRAHPPRLAMIFSACVPGLGQVYNKKYWKVPIVYAAMGTTYYFFGYNNKLYKGYKQSYISKTDTLSNAIDLYPDDDKETVLQMQNSSRKYRDLNIILTALFYTLNIVDAYVDAHLMTFDVSDDLSLHIQPALNLSAQARNNSLGVTLALKF